MADKLYVFVASYWDARRFAQDRGISRSEMCYISHPEKLDSLEGKGKTLWLVGRVEQLNAHAPTIIKRAVERGFVLQ